MFRFKTIHDVDLKGKRVLLRPDINSSIDLEKMEIRSAPRIKALVPTLELLKDSKVVIIAHQGRYGQPDCVDLDLHANYLGELVKPRPVKFVKDLFGDEAKKAIQEVEVGEILVLNNVRQWKPETEKNYTLEEAANTELVRELSPLFDYFINDAFGAAHRAQPSLIGWPTLVGGPIVGRELDACKRVMDNPEHPNIMIIGGAKAKDKFEAMKHNLNSGALDHALVCGLTAILMFEAKGVSMGASNRKLIEKDLEAIKDDIVQTLEKHGEKIVLPVDLVTDDGGKRKVLKPEEVGALDVPTGDVGPATVEEFKPIILGAKTIIANGPAGIFEKEVYAESSFAIVRLMAEATGRGAYTMIGGGDMAVAAEQSGMMDKISFNSTGGGALLEILSGHEMPLVKALNAKPPQ
ncbi:MAG: phosphoglycerate kinase [Promethearchaeota archaeon]